jgi:hypothetical protein
MFIYIYILFFFLEFSYNVWILYNYDEVKIKRPFAFFAVANMEF